MEQAKADGRWAAAYPRQSEIAPDADFLDALDSEPAARALFEELDAANRFAILFRIQQATTPVKRANKITDVVAMLNRGETLHPRKQKRRNASPSGSPFRRPAFRLIPTSIGAVT